LSAIRQDPALSQIKLIAEPWDLGEGGYQVGNFPPGWAEWNGRYRDELRSYWKGDTGFLPELSSGLLGTASLFDKQGRRPWASVNFFTAHDGFTLADLYAYDLKHNEANGEDNLDGHDDNRGWNCGIEGPTEDPQVLNLRSRLRRGAMTALLLSQGTPMLLMGDEIGRTQSGNNNAYCQDNELSWMNWADMSERDDAFFEFVAGVVRVRRDRPLLSQRRFLHAERAMRDGTRNVTWLRPDGKQMAKPDWDNGFARTLGLMLAQSAQSPLLILLNSHHDDINFTTPAILAVAGWRLIVDSAHGLIEPIKPILEPGAELTLPARGVLLLEGRRK
jgi:glycogen operon protein